MIHQPIYYKALLENLLENTIVPNYDISPNDVASFANEFNRQNPSDYNKTFWTWVEVERHTATGPNTVEVEIYIGANISKAFAGTYYEPPHPAEISDITLLAVRFNNKHYKQHPINIIEIMAINNWVESKAGQNQLADKLYNLLDEP